MNDRATPPPDELREALERIEAMGSDVAYQYTRAAAMSEVAREALRAATPAPEPDICGTCDGIGCPVCRPIPEPEYQPDSLGFEHPHTPEETFEVQEANGSRVVAEGEPEDARWAILTDWIESVREMGRADLARLLHRQRMQDSVIDTFDGMIDHIQGRVRSLAVLDDPPARPVPGPEPEETR
jgi:hypothetical protein